MKFIDTHTHLFTEQFDEDRVDIVNKAINAGVEKMLLPNIDVETIQPMMDLMKAFPNNCFPMFGLHPGHVKEDWKERLAKIKIALEKNLESAVAIGEIGMDLYWDKTFVQEQRDAFREQVHWAKEFKLPIVIHAREAFEEIFAILDEENSDELTGVFHCFTGTVEQAAKIKSYGGFLLGIGGVVTYKNGGLDKVLAEIPMNQLILETDSPYLPPVPHRGKRNESSYLLHVAEKLTDIYDMSLKEIAELTTENATKLFSLNG